MPPTWEFPWIRSLEILFLSFCFLVFYVYFLYPAVVGLMARTRPGRPAKEPTEWPTVSLLFCVHNEIELLEAKLANLAQLDYPPGRLEFLAGSDGSTDGSSAALQDAERRGFLRANIQMERTGKTALLNRTVELARHDILLFTDTSTLLRPDAVRRHARQYLDPEVGCVGGELDFVNAASGGVSGGHGLYWRYESWIRNSESALGMLAYVPGANYSMRRDLWEAVPEAFADDCVSPLNVVRAGRRVLYDSNAVAQEVASESRQGLFARRVRMVTRDLEATLRYRALMNPFRYGAVAVSLLSHKLLRWLVPLALVLILILNLFLATRSIPAAPIFVATLGLQAGFYLLAAVGALGKGRPRTPLLAVPLYFCVSNLGALRGLVNVLRRRRIGLWQPVGTR